MIYRGKKMINDDGQGTLRPIMRNSDLLFCQLPDGEYAICDRMVGVIEHMGMEEPSEEFVNELLSMGFHKINLHT